jgi:hypothetical protein
MFKYHTGLLCVLLAVGTMTLPACAGDLGDLIKRATTQGKSYIRNEINKRLGPDPSQAGSSGYASGTGSSASTNNTAASPTESGQPSSGTPPETSFAPQSSTANQPVSPSTSPVSNSYQSHSTAHGPVINGFGSARALGPNTSHQPQSSPQSHHPSSIQVPQESPQGFPVPPDAGVPLYKRHDDPVPKFFPLPSYPGSKASESYSDSDSQHLGLLTADSVYKVFKYYVDYARSKGFSVPSDWCSEDSHNSTLTLRDKRGKWIYVGLSHFYEWTEIQISYQK